MTGYSRIYKIVIKLLFIVLLFFNLRFTEAMTTFLSKSTTKEVNISFLDGIKKSGKVVKLLSGKDYSTIKPQTQMNVLINIENKDWIIPLVSIFEISAADLETISFVSNKDVECFSMGNNNQGIPDPVNWYLRLGNDEFWSKSVIAHQSANWYYIPKAMWIWSNRDWEQLNGETVLFRYPFEIEQNFSITNATLTITADSFLEEVYLNGIKLNTESKNLIGKNLKYDVSLIVENGLNVLGIKASNPYETRINFASVAFSLNVEGYKAENISNSSKSIRLPSVVVLLENLDLIKGELVKLGSTNLTIKTPYAKIQIDNDWVKELVFSSGENIDLDKLSETDRIIFWEIPRKNVINKEGILLKNGKFIEGESVDFRNNQITIKPRLDKEQQINLNSIKSVYLNPSSEKSPPIYEISEEIIPAKFYMTNGDSIIGIIEDINNSKAVISTPYSNHIEIKFDNIMKIQFLYNTLLNEKLKLNEKKLNIGFIGEIRQESQYEDSIYFQTSRVLEMMGLKPTWINPVKIPEKNYLLPDNFELLLNVDEFQQYYQTIKLKNDGYNAVTEYFNNGGNIAHIAIGSPFMYGRVAKRTGWEKTNSENNPNSILKLDIVSPGGKIIKNMKTFELPDNNGNELYFELNRKIAFTEDVYLPDIVPFPEIKDSRFRPVSPDNLSDNEEFIPIYILKDNKGKTYGPAYAFVIFKNADNSIKKFSSYCSHVLLNASYEKVPMVNFIIPHLIDFTANK